MIIIPKGFYFVDDGPRQIFFGPRMVRDIEKKARPDFVFAVNKKDLVLFDPKPVPGVEEVLDTTAFNDNWTRSITFRHARGTIKVNQRLGYINSYYARVDTTQRLKWYAFYLTSELGPRRPARRLPPTRTSGKRPG